MKTPRMPTLDHNKKFYWASRTQYIMALLCQTIGTTTFMTLPHGAITRGAAGYLIGYVVVYMLLGIPLLYMEFIISQFTARDCLQVWRIRPCLKHIGYVYVFWQIIIIIYNHTIASFIIHYFLISFEYPIPYFVCGIWTTKHCGTLEYNYTVNQDCIKSRDEEYSYCDGLYTTFPAVQYWRYYLLGETKTYYYVAWRVCLASAVACFIMFLSCFKRKQSLKWFLSFLTVYPVVGYAILMIGSMMQQGVVSWYGEVLDNDFTMFMTKFSVNNIIVQILYSLNIGTGLSFNMGASTSFRSPCFSNIVISVVICALFTIFAVCTIAMMPCPFASTVGLKPSIFVNYSMALIFEKIPTLLKEFDNSNFWLILIFSCNAVLGLSTSIIIFQQLLEMLAERYEVVHRYPGLTCFSFVSVAFFVTTPLLGNFGVHIIFGFRKMLRLVTIFLTLIECLVFVVWYGVGKFSEDVHFMQGIQPKGYMKLAWIVSTAVVAYVFFSELTILPEDWNSDAGSFSGWCMLILLIGWVLGIMLVKLLIAVFRKRFWEEIKIDPLWGPKSEVLLRSRAMFSAQAMTKEYIYRQYHLQAGILARQRTSNVRRSNLEDRA